MADQSSDKNGGALWKLIEAFGEAMFACGEWRAEDDVQYKVLSDQADNAMEAIDRALRSAERFSTPQGDPSREDSIAPGAEGATTSPGAVHPLYETGDADAPAVIKDRNGEVVLGLCRRCGKGEADLVEPCEPRSPERPIEEIRGAELDRFLDGPTVARSSEPLGTDETVTVRRYLLAHLLDYAQRAWPAGTNASAAHGKMLTEAYNAVHFAPSATASTTELRRQLREIKTQHKTEHDDHDPYWRGVRIGLETAINMLAPMDSTSGHG